MKNVKVELGKDEWYVVEINEMPFDGRIVEVDEATLKRWKRVFEEFEAVQNEMEELYDKSEEGA